MHSDTIPLAAGSCAGKKVHFQVQNPVVRSICHLFWWWQGQLQPAGQSLVFFMGSQAPRGKQILLSMLLLSRIPLCLSKRNENGGWPLIIFRRQDLKVNHTLCNTQYIQWPLELWAKMTEVVNKTVSLMLSVILLLSVLKTPWNNLTSAVFFPDLTEIWGYIWICMMGFV